MARLTLQALALLGAGPRWTTAVQCTGQALAEFDRCVADCDNYACQSDEFSGAYNNGIGCKVLVPLADVGESLLPAEGVWQMRCQQETRCALLKEQIAQDRNCCPHGSSISEYFAVCPNGFPTYTCNIQCAPSFLYFWNECSELYLNHTEYTGLSNDGTETLPLVSLLQHAGSVCQGTLMREGAKHIYEALAQAYFPFGGWIILMVPFMFFLVFVFFGRHLSSLFRMTIGIVAFTTPILWPAIAPFIARCGIGIESTNGDGTVGGACDGERPPFTAELLVTVIFSVMVGMLAGYTCRQLPHIGNAVQGYTLGYVLARWTTDLWIGGMTQNLDTDFLILGISAMFGGVGATLNVLFPGVVNIFGSATIGTFCCCQLFCVIGYFENWYSTFPVSLLAAGLGVAGCQDAACYAYLFCWVFLCIAGIFTQFYSGHVEMRVISKQEAVSHSGRLLFKMHQGFQMLIDLEDSIKEHSEYHTKEEIAELAAHHAATWAAAATGISDVCLLTFGMSLLVGGAELIYRGVYNIMGLYLIVTGTIASLFTLYEMQIHSNITVEERIQKFDIYIWGVFVCVPFAATGFFISLTLGLDSDPLGLHDNFGVDLITDVSSSDGAMTFRTYFMRHMQVASVAFVGLTVTACITCTVVSKNLGGPMYLARKITKFVAILMIVYGAMITWVGFAMIPDEEEFTGAWIYGLVGCIGVLMVLSGLVGVIGGIMATRKTAKKSEFQKMQKQFCRAFILRVFAWFLFVLLALNIFVFISAGIWASNIHASVADDWESINTTMGHYCLAQAEQAAATGSKEPCHLTQEEFVDDVQASFQLAMAVGIVTSIYMLVGLVASLYISFQSGDDLSHSDALVQKHAKEYLDVLAASEKRKKHGKRSALDAKKQKDKTLKKKKPDKKEKPVPAGKKKKAKAKKKVAMEQNASGEWSANAVDKPPPPLYMYHEDDEDDYGLPPPPDEDPPALPEDVDAQMQNPLARKEDSQLGGERVYTKVELKAIERQKKQQVKLQAGQDKKDARNDKAAAKRAAKRAKQEEKDAKKGSAAAPGATFDMEDAGTDALPGELQMSSSEEDPPPEDAVGNYQWVTDSDAETEYETDEEWMNHPDHDYHTTDSDSEGEV